MHENGRNDDTDWAQCIRQDVQENASHYLWVRIAQLLMMLGQVDAVIIVMFTVMVMWMPMIVGIR